MLSLVLVTTAVCILCAKISGISSHIVGANEKDNSTKRIYVQEGKFTHMNCKISNRGLQSVSWIRKNDSLIIAVDEEIFINDSRFASRWNEEFNTFSLQIRNTRERDSGLYECQISGWSKQVYHLDVVVPSTQILTASELIVWCGSDVNITCGVSNFLEKPEEIIWLFSDAIARPNEHINISQKFYPVRNILISTITIMNVKQRDSGNYTCYPLGMQSSTASISVIDGEYPAAMRRSNSMTLFDNLLFIHVILTVTAMFPLL